MSNLFGTPRPTADTAQPTTTLRIQTSVQGPPIPIGWGMNRLAPNLLWFNDHSPSQIQQQGATGGGKGVGGVGGGSTGKQGGGIAQTFYYGALIAGLCEGPITGTGTVWNGKNVTSLAAINGSLFNGSYSQTVWSYVNTRHPTQGRALRGIAYLACGPYFMGASPDLPSINLEVIFGFAAPGSGAGNDANPRDIIVDALTNNKYGVGFPSSRVGDTNLLTLYNYCQALSLWMSPVLIQQASTQQFLSDILYGCVAEALWSAGQLKVIPYFDGSATGNGITYTANLTPQFDLTDDDYLPGTSAGSAPVTIHRGAASAQFNCVRISYTSRANLYNPQVVEAKDDASIAELGLRNVDNKTLNIFCLDAAAQTCAQLQIGREQQVATYEFTIGAKYVLLEPMDLVTLTDVHLGLSRHLVRIKEVTENQDFSLTMLAEEMLVGAASPPVYGQQATTGWITNYNTDPGVTLAPFFFEPTDQLAGGLEVWMAVTGVDLTKWGGCNVYVSYDNTNYQYIGQQLGPTRMGLTTASLATIPVATTPPTIDTTHTLSVNLTESGSQLLTATNADMLGAATLCYLNGEFLAYQTAASTGANAYNLTTLNRGLFGTVPQASSAGAQLVRCDAGVFRIPFNQSRIGQTLFIKLVNFNLFGAGPQSLASVSPYTYVIVGTALTSPLPDVQNFTTNYQSNITLFAWDEITDFRSPIDYEIRRGPDWATGQVLGRYLHPNVPAIGSTVLSTSYRIKAHANPVPGLDVYSANSPSISIAAGSSVIPLNIVQGWDEFSGGTGILTGTFAGGVHNDTNIIVTFGGITSGTYTIPTGHRINVGRVAGCLVDASWVAQGIPVLQNIFSWTDVFIQTDIFGASLNQFISAYANIRLSQDGTTYGSFQRFRAGFYSAMAFDMQMYLETRDAGTIASVSAFSFAVHIPSRIDHYIGLAVPATAGGLTLTFQPDNDGSTRPFNGGPGGTSAAPGLPTYQLTITNVVAGDLIAVSSLTLSGCVIKVTNAGAPVARTVNAEFAGY